MITLGVTSMTIRVILILFLLMVCVSMILEWAECWWIKEFLTPPSFSSDNSWLGSQRRAHSSGSFHFEANEVDCHYRYLYIIAHDCHVTCMWLLHSYGSNGGPISAGVHWARNQESEPVECIKSSLCSGNAHSYNFIVNWFSGNNLPDCWVWNFNLVQTVMVCLALVAQKFRIIPVGLSITGGELTPTMKMKRKVILEKYSHLVTAMYMEWAPPLLAPGHHSSPWITATPITANTII